MSFFKVGSPEFTSAVLRKLSFDVYLSGDVIYKEGNPAAEMFFIRKGKVEITVTGKFIEILNPGDHFGGKTATKKILFKMLLTNI